MAKVAERIPITELQKMDADLAATALRENALFIALAEALLVFAEKKWFEVKSCPNIESYIRQFVQRSASWGKEAILLARRLRELPHLRHAIRRSEIRISNAHRLARLARPDQRRDALHRR